MEKLSHATENILDENVEKLAELFPEAVTEVREPDGSLRHTIDVEALKARVGDVAEGQRERYQFTWPGKRDAKQEAYRPIDKCLRPCPEESVNWDTTKNLYIEGDNLDALKLLRNTYAGKIKMIYIDPPYNTGHDFIYDDDFARTKSDYDAESGDYDGEGGRLVANPESNGRFHSDWCSMMYPRLLLARDLLSEDGALFVSIDDGEVENLGKIMSEVFGERCKVAFIAHKARASVSNDKIISENHNHIAFYVRERFAAESNRKQIGLSPELSGFDLNDNDGRGDYRLVPVDGPGGAKKGNPYFEFLGIEGYWRFSRQTMQQKYEQGLIVRKGNGLYQKYYLSSAARTRRTDTTWWENAGYTSSATSELKKLMGGPSFDTPKPVSLLNRIAELYVGTDPSATVLDFFSGSATTAHAVMKLNAEDGGNRRFIMVQLPEVCDEKSEAAKAGYKNICEIGKERIRRAGKKIAEEVEQANAQLKIGEEPKNVPDIGFRVLKIDSSNFEDVSAEPAEFTQESLMGMADNLKPGRTAEDILFQVMPQFQIPLSASIERQAINGSTVLSVDGGRLVACFDQGVSTETITEMAKMEPDYAVMRNASFLGDAAVSNFGELFKIYSPATITKVV